VKILAVLVLLVAAVASAQNLPPSISPSSLSKAEVQQAYSDSFVLFGTQQQVTWVVSSGALPAGITLSISGSLGGAPLNSGSYPFTVSAQDTRGATIASKAYVLTVLPALAITNTSPLPPGLVNQQYRSVRLQASGGAPPYTYSLQQSTKADQNIPPGLQLSAQGEITGIPLTAGTYMFTVVLTDCALPDSDGFCSGYTSTFPFTMIVVNQLEFTTSTPLQAGATNNGYTQTIVATGGQAPYTFVIKDPQNAPPGLTLAPDTGVLSGSPTATGTFNFNIQVTDSLNFAVAKVFALTIAAGVSPLLVMPMELDFTAAVGGDRPEPQSLSATSTGMNPVAINVTIDGGQPNTESPFMLSVNPINGMTPEGLQVSVAQVDQKNSPLAPGQYTARILVSGIAITVKLTVAVVPARLVVSPAALNASARQAAPGSVVRTLVLHNAGGGGRVNFNASVDMPASWISINPSSGSTMPDEPAVIQVTFHTHGLPVGGIPNSITIHYTQGATKGSITVPVQLFIAGAGAILGVDGVGQRFETQQGMGTSEVIPVTVLNLGDPATMVNFTATVKSISGGAWLKVTPSHGTAGASTPAMVMLSLTSVANSLTPGGYYALLDISDSNAQNSPQHITIVLDVAARTQSARPAPVPEGIVFTARTGGPVPNAISETVNTSSTDTVAFQAEATTTDGATWLSVAPSSGTTSTGTPAHVNISVNQASLPPGVYSGTVNFAVGPALRGVNVTLINTKGTPATSERDAAAPACTPSRLVLTQTGLTNNFAVPAGWPETISVNLNDDCGNLIQNGSVVATFSNGDPALNLPSLQSGGAYSSTWQPGKVTGETTVDVQATAGTLAMATTKIIGGIAQNAAPVLTRGSTVNAYTHGPGPLAPGTITEMHGTGLASGSKAAKPPLPQNIQGTSVFFGNKEAALFSVSGSLIDIEAPPDLTPGRQYNVIVSANGALTLPDVVTLNTVQPYVGEFVENGVTRARAQHLNGSLVKSATPAQPGEVLVLYLIGLGITEPPVAAGHPTPGASKSAVQPTLTINGEQAKIDYAGLTPGQVGLYQINFHVPKDAKAGDLELVVTQDGVRSNTTALRVQ
jgi:uncharacterized protein (TIGR03437 family)